MSRFADIVFPLCLAVFLAEATLAATYTVTTTADSNDGICNADCSLREAIAAANSTQDDDVIEFAPTPFF